MLTILRPRSLCSSSAPLFRPLLNAFLDAEHPAERISPLVGTITVPGEGRIAARPDLAILTLGVEIHATTLAEAMAEASGTMGRVLQAMRAAGLTDADLRTARYSVQVEYDQKTGRPSDSAGYGVVNLVEARVRDLNQVGPVLDEAVAAGANKVLAVTFDVADSGSLENQARAAAMADARGRAEQLARLAGVELGSVVQISEGGTAVPIPRVEVRALAAVSYSTPIEGGELWITARVQATYETTTASGRG